jgi:hypothetical protein
VENKTHVDTVLAYRAVNNQITHKHIASVITHTYIASVITHTDIASVTTHTYIASVVINLDFLFLCDIFLCALVIAVGKDKAHVDAVLAYRAVKRTSASTVYCFHLDGYYTHIS